MATRELWASSAPGSYYKDNIQEEFTIDSFHHATICIVNETIKLEVIKNMIIMEN